ncbi:Cadherin [Magnetococcus marinus MC-1]|uniref:Cadherin n=1 Tax=Magnetococcus marinus (strain ATCC BAA-1437 / JCM 17883 / MC-1) TaxID=156889 RepID=A0L4Q4_MAGMM|nr:ELWxxDGT repeat protein [Magnetococcus marinus]ABK42947.1 Cadherin [Magnetococcus marinus MC-1]
MTDHKSTHRRTALGLLALEPRWMFDGAGAIDATHASQDATVDTQDATMYVSVPEVPGAVATPPIRVLLVASNVADGDDLAAAAQEGVVVVRYDAFNDSGAAILEKIAQALDGREADSIAFATHNAGTGALDITEALPMDLASLAANGEARAFWTEIGTMLNQDGHIDLLGCEVAGSVQGDMLVSLISDIAGRAVAASDDATGNAASGGDWVLERGNVDAATTYFDGERLQDFTGLLRGIELWSTDGTSDGTQLVKDITGTSGDSYPTPIEGTSERDSTVSRSFTVMGGYLYFQAIDGSHGSELWRTNGTTAGTTLVKDINPGSNSSSIQYAVVCNDILYFSANDGSGAALWRSDGTSSGTVKVTAATTAGITNPVALTVLSGKVYFIGDVPFQGSELCVYDPVGNTASAVTDIFPGSTGGVSALENLGTQLVLAAKDSNSNGLEVWVSDGTAAGTTLVKDVRPGPSSGLTLYTPYQFFTVINGKAYFAASDGSHGIEPWVTNGTADGTVMLADVNAGGDSSPLNFTAVGGDVYFTAYDGTASQILTTSGTFASTVSVAGGFNSTPQFLIGMNGILYFSSSNTDFNEEFYFSDGASAGVVKNINIYGSGNDKFYYPAVYNNNLYFRAQDGLTGNELWRSDGTSAGTTQVKNIHSGGYSSSPQYLTVFNGKLYFSGRTTSQSEDNYYGPIFSSSGNAVFSENGGGTVFTAYANADGEVIFTLGGADADKFDINAATGVVTFKSIPDYETPASAAGSNYYELTITATDTSGSMDKALQVLVHNVAPIWSQSAVEVADTSANGTSVATPSSTGDTTSVTWSIQGGNASGLFAINASTGAITIADATKFDHATTPSYTLSVRASDGTTNTDHDITVTVTHVTPGPTFTSGATATFAENGTGIVYTAAATTSGGTVSYAIGGTDGAKFNIDGSSGAVTFKAAPDFEALASAASSNAYTVTLSATDDNGTHTQDVVITVTDAAPAWTALAPVSLNDNSTAGAVVATPVATGDNSGVTWSIQSGNASGLFAINAATGVITVADASKFDFSNTPFYTLSVRATDGNTSADHNLVVAVVHVPSPTSAAQPLPAPPAPPAPPSAPPPVVVAPVGESTVTVLRDNAPSQSFIPLPAVSLRATPPAASDAARTAPAALPASAASVVPVVMTAQFTVSTELGGFRVPVVTASQGGPAVEGLIALHPEILAPDMVDDVVRVSLPADAFAHTRTDAVVVLTAARINGQPLPSWLNFDSRSGTLSGSPPADLKGTTVVKIIARDNLGNEAIITVRINGQTERSGALRDAATHKLVETLTGKPAFTQQLKAAARLAAVRFG